MCLSSEDVQWAWGVLTDAYRAGDYPDAAVIWDCLQGLLVSDPDAAQIAFDVAGDICERRYLLAKADQLRALLTAAGRADAAAAVTADNADDWSDYLMRLGG